MRNVNYPVLAFALFCLVMWFRSGKEMTSVRLMGPVHLTVDEIDEVRAVMEREGRNVPTDCFDGLSKRVAILPGRSSQNSFEVDDDGPVYLYVCHSGPRPEGLPKEKL